MDNCGQAKFKLVNNCEEPIWPALVANHSTKSSSHLRGGFQLEAGAEKTFQLPEEWEAVSLWTRTKCDESLKCETGDCGPKIKCAVDEPQPPFSEAGFLLTADSEAYDVSYEKGKNVDIKVESGGQKQFTVKFCTQ
ncbi:thaumatin-like protein [Aphelenchoides avenae]|nr:thaumatin-like protein [Aphelenchus avenae]